MNINYHDELEAASPWPGVRRMICMDQKLGSAAITQGMVTIEPGGLIKPHTHLVEESMTLLEGDVRVLLGEDIVECRGRRATFLAPANTVHALRNIGQGTAVLCIAYPSVGVTAQLVEGVDF
jgi:quercetin dioxygenase-like cupin family protein